MSRLAEYIAYHEESASIGDIDPSYNMLRYICDRYELNVEQRFWLAFVYAMTYCGASTFYVYNEFPDFSGLDFGRLDRWWTGRGRAEIICQTDRRWVRSSSLFVPAVESYRRWVGPKTQSEHFALYTAGGDTPEARYEKLYRAAEQLYSFGQFALFLYLEALHTITPLDLMPTDLDLNKAWSCRNGLYYAYGLDNLIEDTESRIRPEAAGVTAEKWGELRATLAKLPVPPTVWQTETILCAYRKYHRGKRWIGYYIDRQGLEIAKMADHVKHGVCWDVLWQYREETYDPKDLAEKEIEPAKLAAKGLTAKWKSERNLDTSVVLEHARLSDAPSTR